MPDLADGYTVIGQFPAVLFDVGDYQIQTLQRARRRVGQADAELDGGARPLGCQLDDPEVGCGFVVDVEFEADLVAVETQRPVRIRNRQDDNFERGFHNMFPVGVFPSTSSVSSPRSTPWGMTVWPGSSCSCLPSR